MYNVPKLYSYQCFWHLIYQVNFNIEIFSPITHASNNAFLHLCICENPQDPLLRGLHDLKSGTHFNNSLPVTRYSWAIRIQFTCQESCFMWIVTSFSTCIIFAVKRQNAVTNILWHDSHCCNIRSTVSAAVLMNNRHKIQGQCVPHKLWSLWINLFHY